MVIHYRTLANCKYSQPHKFTSRLVKLRYTLHSNVSIMVNNVVQKVYIQL